MLFSFVKLSLLIFFNLKFLIHESYVQNCRQGRFITAAMISQQLYQQGFGNGGLLGDSIPATITNELKKNLQDVNGNRVKPEEEGDAFQRKVFSTRARQDRWEVR